ncbi:MAG: amidase [Mycolicibacterium neoaurum]|uniref:amidase n=1 Tax=Mycolicibacterium neoaurum TaxID=1795 RepID=UPI002FFB1605
MSSSQQIGDPTMQPYELDLSAAAEAISTRTLSPIELVDSVLAQIDRVDADVSAFVTVTADDARRRAQRVEDELTAGRHRGPLHGIPMAIKDVIDIAGVPTTASSAVLAANIPATDAAVITEMFSAGGISVGKTHTHEFAYGTTTPQSANPWSDDRFAGGSSGGSAIAVSTGMATAALGSDTGGSVRIPAALCGIVGLKPTFGLISRRGMIPLSGSLDHVGTLTRTAADAELMLRALARHDPADPANGLTGVRIGIPKNYFFEHVDVEVETQVRAAIDGLAALGATLVDVDIPDTHLIKATQWGLMVAEAAGYHQQSLRQHPELYSDDVRTLLEAGELMLATDYLSAQRAQASMRQSWAALLTEVDLVAAPTVPALASRKDQDTIHWPDGTAETVTDAYVRLCAPANLTGFPAVSVPVSPATDDGLPIGLQLIGRPFEDAELLRAAACYEDFRGPTTHAWTRFPA